MSDSETGYEILGDSNRLVAVYIVGNKIRVACDGNHIDVDDEDEAHDIAQGLATGLLEWDI